MAANNTIRIADINFSNIKSDLRDYLRSQNTFKDYDFESSGLSYLLDILSYNTYKNAFYLNMIANESFLDSAQIRNNVVSKAKALGYIPRSFRGASAIVQIVVNAPVSAPSIAVAKDTAFTSTIDGIVYKFVIPEALNIPASNGTYSANVTIVQGEPLTHSFGVSSTNPVRYVIPNRNVDVNSFDVSIRQSSANSSVERWSAVSDFSQVTSNSHVYFVQENENQQYELFFGDGTFGKSLTDGNIVNVSYRIVAGSDVNGANTFVAVGDIGGHDDFTLTTQSAASGGANQESIQSIKYNAPKAFSAQNRLVTTNDFKTAILSENGDIEAISVWSGEDNAPPSYGEVFISIKPTKSDIISEQRKNAIKNQLENRKILSINPVIVDATFLYVVPSIEVRYDAAKTSLTSGEVIGKVNDSVVSFENDALGIFDTKFYYSKLLKRLDNSEGSIVSVLATIEMQKRFVPDVNSKVKYNIPFNNAINNPFAGYTHAISSTQFTYNSTQNCQFDDDGRGTLRVYYTQGDSRIYVNENAGTVDYATGLVVVDASTISEYDGDEIKINAEPSENNIFSVRNQILLIADSSISLIDNENNRKVATLSDVRTAGNTPSLLSNQNSNIVF